MASLPQNCCSLSQNITASASLCTNVKGGASDLRLACIRNVTYTEYGCSNTANDPVTGSPPGVVDWIGTYDPDGMTTANFDDDPAGFTAYFYTVDTRDKTLEHLWERTYDIETGTLASSETINFDVDVKDRDFYCTVKSYIGQEVVAIYTEAGSGRRYMVGRTGGLTVTSISGGTGTDEFTPTSFVITAQDADDIFMEIYVTHPANYISNTPVWASMTPFFGEDPDTPGTGVSPEEFTTLLLDQITN
jgi:hypothetical protein